MNALFEGASGERLRRTVWWVMVVLGVFLTAQAISSIFGLRYIGAGIAAANTISVSGYGESFAVPDIATFSFSVVSDKTTVAAAQTDATAKINAVSAYLIEAGIEKKDIQTSDYSIQPQYDYVQSSCTPGVYCPGNQVLKGYEVRQTTTIKVRDTAKAGELLAGVGSKGATEVSGLTFTFDNPDAVEEEARTKAITDAKQKAEKLAKELGVSLVRVTAFSESGRVATPYPYAKLDSAAGSAVAQSAPEISVGQNKVSSDVSVTYEIR